MAGELPVCLKPVKPYFLLSKQFKKRDVVISYYGEIIFIKVVASFEEEMSVWWLGSKLWLVWNDLYLARG